MSGRRMQPHAMKGGPPQAHDGPFGRGPPMPPPPHGHHHLLDEMRDMGPPFGGGGPRGPRGPFPPHPGLIEERIDAQHQEIQGLLVDNQRLAATHVALKQELASVHHELQHASHAVAAAQADRDHQLREMYEKSLKMEAELRAVEGMRAELIQVRGDIQKLNAARQDLTGQVQVLTQDLTKASADVQQAPKIKAEIEAMKQELQQARQAIEYEKKGYAENYEQGTVMEKNLISMAREVEKLRAEIANAEKRARAAAAAGNQGSQAAAGGYGGGNYGNPDPSYGVNSYPPTYGMNPAAGGADGSAHQYGAAAASAQGHGSWGAYDMQRGGPVRR